MEIEAAAGVLVVAGADADAVAVRAVVVDDTADMAAGAEGGTNNCLPRIFGHGSSRIRTD